MQANLYVDQLTTKHIIPDSPALMGSSSLETNSVGESWIIKEPSLLLFESSLFFLCLLPRIYRYQKKQTPAGSDLICLPLFLFSFPDPASLFASFRASLGASWRYSPLSMIHFPVLQDLPRERPTAAASLRTINGRIV